MLLGFKTELKLNNKQRTTLAKHAGVARHAYNWGLGLTKQILDHNQVNPEEKIKFPSAIDLHKWLVVLVKSANLWYYESSKCAPQYALAHLRDAWSRCFNKKAKPPRFKKKGRNDSFTLDGTIKVVGHYKIQIPKIGVLKTFERLPFGYNPKNVTISKTAERWYISFRLEVEPTEEEKSVDVVGVDLGILKLAHLSTNIAFDGAKSFKRYQRKLAKLQWRNRHKIIGSANWRKAQIKIARLHAKIANMRKDTLHKVTTYLAKNHGQIKIEDLNVSGLLSNGKLASSIADMGFYEFRRQLEYKCKLYGSKLIIVDRWFPSSKLCSNCGWRHPNLLLSNRLFSCSKCNLSIDRDWNASLNLSRWSSHQTYACGQAVSENLG